MQFNRKFIIFAVLLYLAAMVSGLFVPLVANAAKYAQISREIIDNGSWLNLTIAHEPYLQKPPMLFWVGAASYSLFGISAWAFKLPVMLYSLAGVFATYKLGNILYNEKTGKLAAFFWATLLGYFYFHNDIHTDTLLATNAIMAIWQFSEFFYQKKQKGFYLGVFFTGLAMLTKGPIGLVVPALAIGVDLLAQKRWKDLFHYRWLFAIVGIGIIISPALLGLYNQFGKEGLLFYFWTNNVGRVTGTYQGINTDPLFYFHNSLYTLAPWTIFAFAGIVLEIRSKISSPRKEFITLGVIIPFLIILSVAKQKNPHYLMAILPLVMILASKWATQVFDSTSLTRTKKLITVSNYILVSIGWLFTLVALILFFPGTNWINWIILAVFLVLTILFIIKNKGLTRQLLLLLTFATAFIVTVNTSIMPKMMEYHSTYKVAEAFNKRATEKDKLYSYRLRFWSSFFYSKNYGTWIPSEKQLHILKGVENAWVYTDTYGLGRLKAHGFEYKITDTFGHRTITGQTVKFLRAEDKSDMLLKFYLVKIE